MARPPITKSRPWTPSRGQFKGRTFATERSYRDALAQAKGFRSWHDQQREAKKVSAMSYGALRESQKQARSRALKALAKMRRGKSLTEAAREAETTPNTVVRYAGSQLHHEGGRMVASKSDRMFRQMWAYTTEGLQPVAVRTSKQASLIGQHRNAVKKFRRGDETALRKFAGVKVGGVELEVRPDVLEEYFRTTTPEFEGPQSG